MLILKNVTAVQLHPAKVQEGVDIAIENDVMKYNQQDVRSIAEAEQGNAQQRIS